VQPAIAPRQAPDQTSLVRKFNPHEQQVFAYKLDPDTFFSVTTDYQSMFPEKFLTNTKHHFLIQHSISASADDQQKSPATSHSPVMEPGLPPPA
jgi:hypothetical protein